MRRQRTWIQPSRAWIACVLALYVGGLAFVGLHDSEHEHRVCEHGEVVHVDAQSSGSCGELDTRSAAAEQIHDSARLTSSSGELGASVAHAHDHCSVALPVACEQRAAGKPEVHVAAPDELLSELRAAPRHRSREPLYLLAPSQSPPLS